MGRFNLFLGFSFYFAANRQPHLNSFGHLLHETEAKFFFPALVAIFAGWLELMMREKAGIAQAFVWSLIPPETTAH